MTESQHAGRAPAGASTRVGRASSSGWRQTGQLAPIALSLWLVPALFIAWELGIARARPGSSLVPGLESRIGSICHHRSDRTLPATGAPVPVCARCSGVWVGWLLAGPVGVALSRARRDLRGWHLSAVGMVLLVGLLPAVLEKFGWIETMNSFRALLGVPLGIAGGALLFWVGCRREGAR